MSVNDRVFELCKSTETISSLLAKDPKLAPGKAAQTLFPGDGKPESTGPVKTPPVASQGELHRAFEAGKWGKTRPSDMFLTIYRDVLCTLNKDVLAGMVSPPLLASSGVLPLTVISTVPDIVRHMSNLIVRAEREVILATNYWLFSDASTFITNALRELSKRAGERGTKAIVKIIYDRGNAKQFFDNHQPVHEKEWMSKAVQLPASHEIPNIDMQVVNYHRPLLGTFHSKYMIVDRKIAILQSNNIQSNDNLEMMCHFEGPIVDSFYDMALISWHNEFKPPLPSHDSPAALGGLGSFAQESHSGMFKSDGIMHGYHVPRKDNSTFENNAPNVHPAINPSNNETTIAEAHAAGANPGGALNETATIEATSINPQMPANKDVLPGEAAIPYTGDKQGNKLDVNKHLPEHSTSDPHYDPDIASEVTRVQSTVSPSGSESRVHAVTRHLNHTIQPNTTGDAPECAPGEEMWPYIPHPVHEPFPIVMVCRKPFGAPDMSSVNVPQNAAWLSAIRNAKESVFIQSPDMNAEPLIPELLAAVRRGIQVICYVCLGYNDTGELLPYQGGTNEMVLHKMYASLEAEQKKNLHAYFYVGKDQTKPINNKFKKRSCHIKLMIVDEHIGIQGNGNQDTQSWYHSQEINVMLDSATICSSWVDAIRRNQNTHIYGKVSAEDGIWKDKDGKEAEGSIGIDPGRFSWAKGIIGAVQRVRGAGNF